MLCRRLLAALFLVEWCVWNGAGAGEEVLFLKKRGSSCPEVFSGPGVMAVLGRLNCRLSS